MSEEGFEADTVICGAGNDSARAHTIDVLLLGDCESVRRFAEPTLP